MNLLDIDKTFFLVYASLNELLIVTKISRDTIFWKDSMIP